MAMVVVAIVKREEFWYVLIVFVFLRERTKERKWKREKAGRASSVVNYRY